MTALTWPAFEIFGSIFNIQIFLKVQVFVVTQMCHKQQHLSTQSPLERRPHSSSFSLFSSLWPPNSAPMTLEEPAKIAVLVDSSTGKQLQEALSGRLHSIRGQLA
ncbi:hypothetical protein L596_020256 [Steinernema carpocapsae]|uniref:Uncharacterized protein n=1 Tax=Steinernema carpocapsae TaxID=34508 RepID=A0A4U5MT00_STECR|nr:hypothetical protein L596_020256 [Steinernema carpocapsae]